MAAGALTSSLALTLRPPLRFQAPPIWIPAGPADACLALMSVYVLGLLRVRLWERRRAATGRIPAPAALVGNISPHALIGDKLHTNVEP